MQYQEYTILVPREGMKLLKELYERWQKSDSRFVNATMSDFGALLLQTGAFHMEKALAVKEAQTATIVMASPGDVGRVASAKAAFDRKIEQAGTARGRAGL